MQVIYKIALLFSMLIGVLLPTRAETASATRLRIGYPSPSASFFPLFATKEAGLLEKYGFDSEMIYVQGVQLVQVHVADAEATVNAVAVVIEVVERDGGAILRLGAFVVGNLELAAAAGDEHAKFLIGCNRRADLNHLPSAIVDEERRNDRGAR